MICFLRFPWNQDEPDFIFKTSWLCTIVGGYLHNVKTIIYTVIIFDVMINCRKLPRAKLLLDLCHPSIPIIPKMVESSLHETLQITMLTPGILS